ncbi:MAG: acyltransferase family protein [Fuerstiella sp.]
MTDIVGSNEPSQQPDRIVEGFCYRPDIDGLRAIAVLAVVLFHAGLGFPGGYVGVDVFFVISGFLITSLIIKDLEQDKFSLVGFWERRVRRIWPPLIVMSVGCLLAGWFYLLPDDYQELGESTVWQNLFASNIFFWRESGYFEGPADEKPLLHTWSLAVEEQFYLFLPLLLSVVAKVNRLSRRFLVSAFAAGIVASLALSVYGVAHHPGATFYLLPTRVWELLLGSLLSVLSIRFLPRNHRVSEFAGALGLIAIAVPCFLYDEATPFPGLSATIPCFGTALVIWSSMPTGTAGVANQTLVGKLLSNRGLVFVGFISYSLYLWHWPVFVFAKHSSFFPLSLGDRVKLLGLSFFLAVVSWKFIETPFRLKAVFAKRNQLFKLSGAISTLVVVSGVAIMVASGIQSRFSNEALTFIQAQDDREFTTNQTLEEVEAGRLPRFGKASSERRPSVLLWGDSHAHSAMPALDKILKQRGLVGVVATHSATSPVLDYYRLPQNGYGLRESAPKFSRAVLSYAETVDIKEVILVGCWVSDHESVASGGTIGFDEAILRTISELRNIGCRVWVMLQVPTHPVDVPRALVYSATRNIKLDEIAAKPSKWNGLYGDGSEFLQRAITAGARLLNPRPEFLDPKGYYFMMAKDGCPLYVDKGHLTAAGSRLILAPFFDRSLPDDFGQSIP